METFGGEAGAQGAVCAIHTQTPATTTCARCGNYACQECTEWGQYDVCPSCRERLGIGSFPFDRNNWSVGGLLSYSWDVFTRDWLMLVLLSVIFFGVSGGISFVMTLVGTVFQGDAGAAVGFTIFNQILQTVVNMALSLGTIGVIIDTLLGGGVDLARFLGAMKNLGKALVQYFVVLLGIWLPIGLLVAVPFLAMDDPQDAVIVVAIVVLVLAVPLTYVGLGLVFMQYELVHDEACGPIEAIRRSWELVRGYRLWTFLIGLLGLLIFLAGMILCCVGMVATYPIFMLLMTSFYLALRNGSGLPNPTRNP